MHVAIFADMEGAFGIWRMRQCHTGTAQWQYGRECLTQDVNRAVEGALAGGADRVTVKDIHDTAFNILRNRLDRRVGYVGGHYIKPTFFGDLSKYDLILYLAIHAASGTKNAFFPHTHLGVFTEIRVNDKPAGEMDIYGGFIGEHGVPIGLVTGEDIAVQQAKEVLPWALSVEVDKQKETYTNGKTTRDYLVAGRQELAEQAERAVRQAGQMKPLVIKGPLEFEADFKSEALATRMNTWDFKRSGATVRWSATDMKEGFEKLNRLTFFPKKIYPYRRQFALVMRSYHRIRNNFFAPAPDREYAIY